MIILLAIIAGVAGALMVTMTEQDFK